MKKLITIIVPAFNEEESLPNTIERLNKLATSQPKYNFEFLFVNDGSRDKTAEILNDLAVQNGHVSVINFSRNFGKEIAVAAGIDHAQGDAIVMMDADGQEPPELIPEMIKWWERGYDDVYARRHVRADSRLRKFNSAAYYRTLQKMTRVPIQIDTGDFRLLDKKCIMALRQCHEVSRQNKALFSWIGYKKKEITYDQKPRQVGETKWHFGFLSAGNSLFNLAIDGFTSFTTLPLRYITVAGLATLLIDFIYLVVVIIRACLGLSQDAGFNTLLIIILLMGGIELIAMGILGEYVGRTFNEAKHRPLYLIQDMHQAKFESKETKDGRDKASK